MKEKRDTRYFWSRDLRHLSLRDMRDLSFAISVTFMVFMNKLLN